MLSAVRFGAQYRFVPHNTVNPREMFDRSRWDDEDEPGMDARTFNDYFRHILAQRQISVQKPWDQFLKINEQTAEIILDTDSPDNTHTSIAADKSVLKAFSWVLFTLTGDRTFFDKVKQLLAQADKQKTYPSNTADISDEERTFVFKQDILRESIIGEMQDMTGCNEAPVRRRRPRATAMPAADGGNTGRVHFSTITVSPNHIA